MKKTIFTIPVTGSRDFLDKPLRPGETEAIEAILAYRKNGRPRGYYLSIHAIRQYESGTTCVFEFGNFICRCVRSVARFSAKDFASLIDEYSTPGSIATLSAEICSIQGCTPIKAAECSATPAANTPPAVKKTARPAQFATAQEILTCHINRASERGEKPIAGQPAPHVIPFPTPTPRRTISIPAGYF